ncbi:MAG: hemolysin III family protein [Deltaproteobacteria bacterium]|nr:hemolysin III family protein [Deltaproteobacteria bacterium]MBW2448249.1 hemolysin III family protein [Deltaproteobacteria bacterium]
MRFSGELSTPLGWVDDPMACALHLLGAAWFGWQALQLVRRAGDARRRGAALAIFTGSAVVVLGTSAVYHALPATNAWKPLFQRLDHSAIFVLIAGTLTAYHAVGFRGRARWWMVGGVWLATAAAVAGKLALWSSLGDGAGLALYVGISALGLSSILFLPRKLPWEGYALMGAGGLVYVGGALLDQAGLVWIVPGVFGPHEIFHTAVLTALVLHWRFFHEWAAPGRVPEPQAAPVLQGI